MYMYICVQSSESHKALFEGHEVASAHLIEAVMRIFVDIEYTGDSLEFEAKFREETSSLSLASLSILFVSLLLYLRFDRTQVTCTYMYMYMTTCMCVHRTLHSCCFVCAIAEYRIPMYEVLKFVWVLPSYRASVELLSRQAVEYDGREQEMPILLRFINMIINDATVQLDEGLEVWGNESIGVWVYGVEGMEELKYGGLGVWG